MTDDRRIGLQVPQYNGQEFHSKNDLAYWEVLYDDGTVQRETDLKPYNSIDRGRLKTFRIVYGGEIVVECWPEPTKGSTGHNLVFRRRTAIGVGAGRGVVLLFGFAPMGPVWALNLDNETIFESPDGFVEGDPLLNPPASLPGEPQEMIQKKG